MYFTQIKFLCDKNVENTFTEKAVFCHNFFVNGFKMLNFLQKLKN